MLTTHTNVLECISLRGALPIFIQASAVLDLTEDDFDFLTSNKVWIATRQKIEIIFGYGSAGMPRSEERFSRNAETDLVCRLLLEKKNRFPVRAFRHGGAGDGSPVRAAGVAARRFADPARPAARRDLRCRAAGADLGTGADLAQRQDRKSVV